MIRSSLLLICLLSLRLSGVGQTDFEGKVISSVKVLEAPEKLKGKESLLGQILTTFHSEGRVRAEQTGALGTTVIIKDPVKKEVVMLMDMLGQKIAMVLPVDKKTTADDYGLSISGRKLSLTGEKKQIAGYTCVKAVVGEGADQQEVWFAEELRDMPGVEKGMPGMPMDYILRTNGMKMQLTVTEIREEDIPESLFRIPAEYAVKTQKEMEQFMPLMTGSGFDD